VELWAQLSLSSQMATFNTDMPYRDVDTFRNDASLRFNGEWVSDHYSEHSMRILKRYTWHYSPTMNHYVRRAVKNFLTGDRHQIELIATLPAAKSIGLRVTALQDELDP